MSDNHPPILGADGKPARPSRPQPPRRSDACPGCGAGREERVQAGFSGGQICGCCGHEFGR